MPHRYDLQALGLDFLELLTRFLPTEYERSLITRFEQEQRPIEELSEEDRFMLRFSRIPRLPERMNTLIFLGNFPDTAQLLMPVCAGRQGGAAWAGLGRRQLVAWAPREHLGLGRGGGEPPAPSPTYHASPIPPSATECCHCGFNVHQVLRQTPPDP